MNDKRKRLASNQWFKFLNRASGVASSPANTESECHSSQRRSNMKFWLSYCKGKSIDNRKDFLSIFGAYVIDRNDAPELIDFDVIPGLCSGADILRLHFNRLHCDRVRKMFKLMDEFAPFKCSNKYNNNECSISIAVRHVERKIDLIPKPKRKPKPETIEITGMKTIDVKSISISELETIIKAAQIELRERNLREINVMLEDYYQERDKLLKMKEAILTRAGQSNVTGEIIRNLEKHKV